MPEAQELVDVTTYLLQRSKDMEKRLGDIISAIDVYRRGRQSTIAVERAVAEAEKTFKSVQPLSWGPKLHQLADQYGHLDLYGQYAIDRLADAMENWRTNPDQTQNSLREFVADLIRKQNAAQTLLGALAPLQLSPSTPESVTTPEISLVFRGGREIKDFGDLREAAKEWHDILHPVLASSGSHVGEARIKRVANGSIEITINLPETAVLLFLGIYNLALDAIKKKLEIAQLIRTLKTHSFTADAIKSLESQQPDSDEDGYYGRLVEQELAAAIHKDIPMEQRSGLGLSVKKVRHFIDEGGLVEPRLPPGKQTPQQLLLRASETYQRIEFLSESLKPTPLIPANAKSASAPGKTDGPKAD